MAAAGCGALLGGGGHPADERPVAGRSQRGQHRRVTPADEDAVVALYERYLAACNEHRVDELGEFVSEQVSGSGPVDGLSAFTAGVREVCTAFPDYRWEVQERIVRGDTIAVRLVGRGTHTADFCGIPATGRRVETQELVVYRVADGKIVRCWGDLFPVVRDALHGEPRG